MVAEKGIWNLRFVHLLLVELLLQFGMYLTRPLVSGYAVTLGASLSVAGFLAGLLATAALLARPACGVISDRLSKKTLLVASCALFSLSAWGCAFARSIVQLGCFLALQGVAFAFKSTVVVSMASLVVPSSKVGSAVGWLGVAYTCACALGPALGSFASSSWGYAGSFAVAAAFLTAGLVLAASFRSSRVERSVCDEEVGRACGRSGEGETGIFKRLFYGPVVALSAAAGLLMVAQGVTASFMLVVGDMRGVEGASLYFLVYALAAVAARPLAGRASDVWGLRAVALPMMLLAFLGMVVAAFSNAFAGIMVAGVCMGLGQGSAYSAMQAESVRGVDSHQVGRAANTFYIGPDLCMGLGPVVGGLFLQWSAGAMFLFNAASIVAGMLLLVVFRSARR